MTTCVYKDGTLCIDSRVEESSGIVRDYQNKLFYSLIEGCHGALIGDYGPALTIWRQYLAQEEFAVPDGSDFEVLIARGGQLFVIDGGMVPQSIPTNTFHTFGSGAQIAWGACKAGATAFEAISAACEGDPYTGGPIKSMHLWAKKE